MKSRELKRELSKKTPNEILTEYMEGTIFLNQWQLQQVINMKTGKDIGRGSSYKWRGK